MFHKPVKSLHKSMRDRSVSPSISLPSLKPDEMEHSFEKDEEDKNSSNEDSETHEDEKEVQEQVEVAVCNAEQRRGPGPPPAGTTNTAAPGGCGRISVDSELAGEAPPQGVSISSSAGEEESPASPACSRSTMLKTSTSSSSRVVTGCLDPRPEELEVVDVAATSAKTSPSLTFEQLQQKLLSVNKEIQALQKEEQLVLHGGASSTSCSSVRKKDTVTAGAPSRNINKSSTSRLSSSSSRGTKSLQELEKQKEEILKRYKERYRIVVHGPPSSVSSSAVDEVCFEQQAAVMLETGKTNTNANQTQDKVAQQQLFDLVSGTATTTAADALSTSAASSSNSSAENNGSASSGRRATISSGTSSSNSCAYSTNVDMDHDHSAAAAAPRSAARKNLEHDVISSPNRVPSFGTIIVPPEGMTTGNQDHETKTPVVLDTSGGPSSSTPNKNLKKPSAFVDAGRVNSFVHQHLPTFQFYPPGAGSAGSSNKNSETDNIRRRTTSGASEVVEPGSSQAVFTQAQPRPGAGVVNRAVGGGVGVLSLPFHEDELSSSSSATTAEVILNPEVDDFEGVEGLDGAASSNGMKIGATTSKILNQAAPAPVQIAKINNQLVMRGGESHSQSPVKLNHGGRLASTSSSKERSGSARSCTSSNSSRRRDPHALHTTPNTLTRTTGKKQLLLRKQLEVWKREQQEQVGNHGATVFVQDDEMNKGLVGGQQHFPPLPTFDALSASTPQTTPRRASSTNTTTAAATRKVSQQESVCKMLATAVHIPQTKSSLLRKYQTNAEEANGTRVKQDSSKAQWTPRASSSRGGGTIGSSGGAGSTSVSATKIKSSRAVVLTPPPNNPEKATSTSSSAFGNIFQAAETGSSRFKFDLDIFNMCDGQNNPGFNIGSSAAKNIKNASSSKILSTTTRGARAPEVVDALDENLHEDQPKTGILQTTNENFGGGRVPAQVVKERNDEKTFELIGQRKLSPLPPTFGVPNCRSFSSTTRTPSRGAKSPRNALAEHDQSRTDVAQKMNTQTGGGSSFTGAAGAAAADFVLDSTQSRVFLSKSVKLSAKSGISDRTPPPDNDLLHTDEKKTALVSRKNDTNQFRLPFPLSSLSPGQGQHVDARTNWNRTSRTTTTRRGISPGNTSSTQLQGGLEFGRNGEINSNSAVTSPSRRRKTCSPELLIRSRFGGKNVKNTTPPRGGGREQFQHSLAHQHPPPPEPNYQYLSELSDSRNQHFQKKFILDLQDQMRELIHQRKKAIRDSKQYLEENIEMKKKYKLMEKDLEEKTTLLNKTADCLEQTKSELDYLKEIELRELNLKCKQLSDQNDTEAREFTQVCDSMKNEVNQLTEKVKFHAAENAKLGSERDFLAKEKKQWLREKEILEEKQIPELRRKFEEERDLFVKKALEEKQDAISAYQDLERNLDRHGRRANSLQRENWELQEQVKKLKAEHETELNALMSMFKKRIAEEDARNAGAFDEQMKEKMRELEEAAEARRLESETVWQQKLQEQEKMWEQKFSQLATRSSPRASTSTRFVSPTGNRIDESSASSHLRTRSRSSPSGARAVLLAGSRRSRSPGGIKNGDNILESTTEFNIKRAKSRSRSPKGPAVVPGRFLPSSARSGPPPSQKSCVIFSPSCGGAPASGLLEQERESPQVIHLPHQLHHNNQPTINRVVNATTGSYGAPAGAAGTLAGDVQQDLPKHQEQHHYPVLYRGPPSNTFLNLIAEHNAAMRGRDRSPREVVFEGTGTPARMNSFLLQPGT
ncbi:unnamed protein product [Amoebophrya sp. A120]|nr:unnamed protein product [Amoebophrya sp. A120]|eukprot:GSA120T00009875001.1